MRGVSFDSGGNLAAAPDDRFSTRRTTREHPHRGCSDARIPGNLKTENSPKKFTGMFPTPIGISEKLQTLKTITLFVYSDDQSNLYLLLNDSWQMYFCIQNYCWKKLRFSIVWNDSKHI